MALPAWLKASLRAMRAPNAEPPKRPSVRAEISGATAVSPIPIRPCAKPMTHSLRVSTITAAPTAIASTEATTANLLRCVRSTSTPRGAVATSPLAPASDMATPVAAGSKPLAWR